MIDSDKLVAVSQRVDVIEDREEVRDSLDQRLISWLASAGFTPIPVPNLGDSNRVKQWITKIAPSALVLSGGNNIGEFNKRDETERELLKWAWNNRIPALGICRGMQMMAVFAGVELREASGHVRKRHTLEISEGTGDWPSSVNSYHNLQLSDCPSDFTVAAKSEDGSIEAICHNSLPWEAWMWHPEREAVFSLEDTTRLQRLFNEN